MRKMSIVRFAAAAAMLGSVGLAVASPGVAGAKGVVTGSCTLFLGTSTSDLATGCTGGRSTPDAVAVPNASDNGATITFLNKKTVTETFTYTSVTSTCPTNSYGNSSATTILEEQEHATVTGGNAKFSLGPLPPSNVCIYLNADGTILVDGANGISL